MLQQAALKTASTAKTMPIEPYIADDDMPSLPVDVRDFEPSLALRGGPDGLAVVRRIVTEAPGFLAPAGALALEVGAGQAPEVCALFEAAGFTDIDVRRDYAKIERIVSGVRPG